MQLIFLLTILFLPFVVIAKNIELEAVGFAEESSVRAQVAVWNDTTISPARYATQQAVLWYKRQIAPSLPASDSKQTPDEFILIFLGQTTDEVWTLEGGLENDAETSYFFNFVRTSKDGKHREKAIIPPIQVEEKPMPPEMLEKKLLENLWRVTNQVGDQQTKLQPANIVFDRRDLGTKLNSKSCSVRAQIAGKSLCYSVTHTNSMCWHFYKWVKELI